MEELPRRIKLLQFYPETLAAVRKVFNLDKRMTKESIDVLEEWVKKQAHFVKKDFSRDYLERSIVSNKGSIERAKNGLDKLCTYKTLMPELFMVRNIEGIQTLRSISVSGALPKLTQEHNRVYLMRVNGDGLGSEEFPNFFKLLIMVGEFYRRYEYCSGVIIALDLRDVNILNAVSKINPLELRKVMTVLIEGYSVRVLGIHMLSESKLIDSFVTLFRQVVSAKIGSRIRVHKTLESFQKLINPIDILPEEYGGKEMPLANIFDEWFKIFSSDEHIEYMIEMNKAVTIESCRSLNYFNEQYIGMPGSFRALNVD